MPGMEGAVVVNPRLHCSAEMNDPVAGQAASITLAEFVTGGFRIVATTCHENEDFSYQFNH